MQPCNVSLKKAVTEASLEVVTSFLRGRDVFAVLMPLLCCSICKNKIILEKGHSIVVIVVVVTPPLAIIMSVTRSF